MTMTMTRFSGVIISAVLAALLCSLLAVRPAAPAAAAGRTALPRARSGHVVSRTRRFVGEKLPEEITADLWFTTTRSRLSTYHPSQPAVLELFDGQAMYRWTEDAKRGQTWRPAGLRVLPDIVAPLFASERLPRRKRVGAASVAGLPCALYSGTRKAPEKGKVWWKGTLTVRVWESTDRRFPYVLRSTAKDASGNRVESEVVKLSLDVPVPDRLFAPPRSVAFYRPAQVRRGRQVADASRLAASAVAIHLADVLAKGRPSGGRRLVDLDGERLALDAKPLATQSSLEEARLEPYGLGLVPAGEALVLYLEPAASAVLARASARARGRRLVVLIGGEPVSATRVQQPWAEEQNRVPVFGPGGRLLDLARRLNPRFGK
ncbi:MAG: hypothetical protein HY321_19225 [Armatimonadetes bacterium]|nr:hypothetical protein [Armatimonadota bacterium]